MTIMKMLTPIAQVQWLSISDTVRDAFDHLETYDANAAPLLDWSGRYVGTITEADLRRHVTGAKDRAAAMETPLLDIERRAHNPPVTVERGFGAIVNRAAGHGFIPVVDAAGRLVGVIDRRRLHDRRFPSAA